ncbi:unnamed protein product [Hymenolepis diminuta]|uniref:Uncharacterized protein n=1 Tax=Hymenolepis diminuta TaxID=6216 RepID=A0A3P6ZLV1_HYMDI|nr:unnamed protein product [Hymenolepis diminuta]
MAYNCSKTFFIQNFIYDAGIRQINYFNTFIHKTGKFMAFEVSKVCCIFEIIIIHIL